MASDKVPMLAEGHRQLTEEVKRLKLERPEIIDAIYRLIGTFDPEFQARLRDNVILAGGGSRLSGLALLIERDLKGLGGGNVTAVEEPMYAGANGGLKIAMEMPVKYWKALV